MTATWSPRSFSWRSASRACSPDSARTIRCRSPYCLRRSRATARETLGSSSTVTIAGRSSASPVGRVMSPSYADVVARSCRGGLVLEAEVLAALRPDEGGVGRVLLDPGADVGAEGQHREPAPASVVEAEPRQLGGQVRVPEGGLGLGVDEADRAVALVQLVLHEAGELGPHMQFIPGGGRVVAEHRRVGGGCIHGRYDK